MTFQFQPRYLANGSICCENRTNNPTFFCSACREEYAEQEQQHQRQERVADKRFAPPDAYAEGLAALRAAQSDSKARVFVGDKPVRSEDPLIAYEKQYKEERARAYAEEAARRTRNDRPRSPRRLSADELRRYAPPDPYSADLQQLRNKQRR